MEDISIPMLRGNMEDIGQDSSVMDASSDNSVANSQSLYDRENRYIVMFLFLSILNHLAFVLELLFLYLLSFNLVNIVFIIF